MESGGFAGLQLTNIEEVIARVTSVFAAKRPTDRDISLDTNMQSELPHTQADPDRIAQVLVNLLANAVHHTPDCGRISVSASRTDDNIVVSVTDSGPGIAEEDLTPYPLTASTGLIQPTLGAGGARARTVYRKRDHNCP